MLRCQLYANLMGSLQNPRLDSSKCKSRQRILISNDFFFCAWRVYFQNVLRAGSDQGGVN